MEWHHTTQTPNKIQQGANVQSTCLIARPCFSVNDTLTLII